MLSWSEILILAPFMTDKLGYCLFFVLKISGSSLLCTVVFVWMVDTILKDWIMQRIRSTDAGNFIISSADIMWTLLPFAAVGSCLDT